MIRSIKVPCPYCGYITGLWWNEGTREYRSFCEACQNLIRCEVHKNHLVLKRSAKLQNDVLSNHPVKIMSDYDSKKRGSGK